MNGEHVGHWDSVPNRPQEFTYAASWTTSEAAGHYRLTPRYDVLSAFPILGKKSGELARQRIKMAMAVIATVNARLPRGFPGSVSEPILTGLEASARVLAG
jgi:hypothetical protein